jgi:hypothetical protein
MTTSRSGLDRRSDVLLVLDSGADPSAFAELYERHVVSVYRWRGTAMYCWCTAQTQPVLATVCCALNCRRCG